MAHGIQAICNLLYLLFYFTIKDESKLPLESIFISESIDKNLSILLIFDSLSISMDIDSKLSYLYPNLHFYL